MLNLDSINWSVWRDSLPWLKDKIIFLTKHGSQAYGTSTPTSDLDIKGVAVPPSKYFNGFLHKFEQAEGKDPDVVVYDIRKFLNLASDCNPSIIEILFTDPEDHIHVNHFGAHLIASRNVFLSKKAKHTFSGYAIAQLKRIQTHKKWITNPVKEKPTRAQFGLPEKTLIPADHRQAIEAAIKKRMDGWNIDFGRLEQAEIINVQNQIRNLLEDIELHHKTPPWMIAARSIGCTDSLIDAIDREKRYNSALIAYQQYQNWKATRNPVRAAIEEKYGYDCKNAMHLVRLMRMCYEILSTGKVIVKRPDAEELLAIRNGAWTYDQLLDWAKKQEAALEELYEITTLPNGPDRVYIDTLCQAIVGSQND